MGKPREPFGKNQNGVSTIKVVEGEAQADCNDCNWHDWYGSPRLAAKRKQAHRHVAQTGHSVVVTASKQFTYAPQQ